MIKISYTYQLNTTVTVDENKNPLSVFGIDAVNQKGQIVMSVPDLFFNKQEAEHLVALCNEGELSLLHLTEIAEDALV